MTIGGAIAELQNLIDADDVPFYYKSGINKVIETIQMEVNEQNRLLKEIAHRLDLHERAMAKAMRDTADTPQTDIPRCSINGTPFDECGFCEHFNCDTCHCEADTPQTESTGSPIGDYRDGVGAWQTDCDDRYAIRTDSGEVVAHACPLGCERTDCGWR